MTAQELTGDFLLLNAAIRYFAPPELIAESNRRMALPKPQPPPTAASQLQLAYTTERLKHQNYVDEPWEEAKQYLFALIFHRRLEAWGVMRSPQARIRHERIPPELFDAPRSGWSPNVIKKHGHCYVSVVVKIPAARHPAHNSGDSTAVLAPETQDQKQLVDATRKRGGRPSLVNLVAPIIEELEGQGAFDGKIKKERDDLIGKTARARHPRQFAKETHPSPLTIDRAWTVLKEKDSKKYRA
jgi:hypothetical protein